jgi:hypothetical protein
MSIINHLPNKINLPWERYILAMIKNLFAVFLSGPMGPRVFHKQDFNN